MSDKFSTFNHEFPPGFAFYFFLVWKYRRQGNQLECDNRSKVRSEDYLVHRRKDNEGFQRKTEQDILTDLDERNEESVIPNVELGE